LTAMAIAPEAAEMRCLCIAEICGLWLESTRVTRARITRPRGKRTTLMTSPSSGSCSRCACRTRQPGRGDLWI
jgi:hypothetical protein